MALPLQIVVITLYHAAIKPVDAYGVKQALRTIKILLEHGALWWNGCSDIYVLNTEKYNWVHFYAEYPHNGPTQLAVY